MYKNLKAFRESIGITQKDFAASLGIGLTTYNGYETGARDPKSDFWIAVAQKYGVTIDYLMGYSNDPHKTGVTEKIAPAPKRQRSARPHRLPPASGSLSRTSRPGLCPRHSGPFCGTHSFSQHLPMMDYSRFCAVCQRAAPFTRGSRPCGAPP